MTKKNWLDNLIFVVAMAAALVALWTVAALAVGNSFVLPNVPDVCRELGILLAKPSFYASVGVTVGRALLAFAVSLAFALALALLANLFPVRRPLSAVVTLLRALPTMSIIFLCIVLFPSRAIAYIVTFLVVFPVMYAAFDGALAQAKPLADMCKVFNVQRADKAAFVYIPTLAPQVALQCRSTIALAVKVCIAGEALAMPRSGIGVEMYVARVNLDTANLLAWTLTALVCCYAIDGLFALGEYLVKRAVGMSDEKAKNDSANEVNDKYDTPQGKNANAENVCDNTVETTTKDDLHLEKVSVKFGERTLYDNLDVTFAAGKVHVVLGASGCGKTTLLNVVSGLVSHSGAVSGAKHCSYVFQEARLSPCRVLTNVELVLRRDIKDKELRRRTAMHALAMAQLADKANRNVATLSGGEAQRVSLARAFATNADVLLADEPMKSLDLGVKRNLYVTLSQMLEQKPLTTLYVTHDVEEAVMLADEVYLAEGSPCTLTHIATIAAPRADRKPWSEESVRLKMQLETALLQSSTASSN